jgi:hypothetical protein
MMPIIAGHTLMAITGEGLIIDQAAVNARVSNGRIVAGLGIANYGSDRLITGLNIAVGTSLSVIAPRDIPP